MLDPNQPLVSIIMGSDSDLPVMVKAGEVLRELGIPYEERIISAHRTPDEMQRFGSDAPRRGIRIVIAGAGGAAHLPGMTAAFTTLPVIGVPVRSQALNGMDSLLSIAQMPPGVPVATMAIDGARNAGIFAAQVIGAFIPEVAERIHAFKQQMSEAVRAKDTELHTSGAEAYLTNHPPKRGH